MSEDLCRECGSKNIIITADSWSSKPFNTTIYCDLVECHDCNAMYDINLMEESK